MCADGLAGPQLAGPPPAGIAQLAPQFDAPASSYTYPFVWPFETPRRGGQILDRAVERRFVQVDRKESEIVPRPSRPWWIRLLLSLVAGLGSAVLVAIALAVVDLYLTGHGLRPLSAPLVDWSAAGVHLSLADVIFLGAAAVAAAITWRLTAAGGA